MVYHRIFDRACPALAHSRQADEKDVAGLLDEASCGQGVDLLAVDAGVEREVEAVEASALPEGGGLEPAF
jgi:hypothetical protein